jgi:hypothetical protein
MIELVLYIGLLSVFLLTVWTAFYGIERAIESADQGVQVASEGEWILEKIAWLTRSYPIVHVNNSLLSVQEPDSTIATFSCTDGVFAYTSAASPLPAALTDPAFSCGGVAGAPMFVFNQLEKKLSVGFTLDGYEFNHVYSTK